MALPTICQQRPRSASLPQPSLISFHPPTAHLTRLLAQLRKPRASPHFSPTCLSGQLPHQPVSFHGTVLSSLFLKRPTPFISLTTFFSLSSWCFCSDKRMTAFANKERSVVTASVSYDIQLRHVVCAQLVGHTAQ